MRRLRVNALLATTSFALYLAERWDDVGRDAGEPSALYKVLGGGEPGLGQAEIRARIQRGLKLSHLRETMGLGDVLPSMWGECEQQDGMHFNAQRYVAVELIDPDTGEQKAWTDGASGELVYTTFARDATPVVRYRSRDHAQVIGLRCACGRTSPRIRVIGRTDDMLIYKGMNVFPTAIRDFVAQRFAGQVEPLLRIVKDHKDQVRFDHPIAGRDRGLGVARRRAAGRAGAGDRRRGARAAAGARGGQRAAARRAAARRVQESARGRARQPAERIRRMKFQRAAFSSRHLWSSPFVRWQGRLADVSSLDVAVAVTRDALAQRRCELDRIDQLVLGTTIPQPRSFYAVPWIASRLGMPGHHRPAHRAGLRHVGGVRGERGAADRGAGRVAGAGRHGGSHQQRAVARIPAPARDGRQPGDGELGARQLRVRSEHRRSRWCTPPRRWRARARCRGRRSTSSRCCATSSTERALADDRRIQRTYLQPVVIEHGRTRLVVEADEGVHDTTADGLRALKPVHDDGVVTFGSQTHPADGAAGALRAGSRRRAHAGRWRRGRAAGLGGVRAHREGAHAESGDHRRAARARRSPASVWMTCTW